MIRIQVLSGVSRVIEVVLDHWNEQELEFVGIHNMFVVFQMICEQVDSIWRFQLGDDGKWRHQKIHFESIFI